MGLVGRGLVVEWTDLWSGISEIELFDFEGE